MQFGPGTPVKIGFTRNMGLRLEVISTSHYLPMSLLYALAGGRALEKQIHRIWDRHRIGATEWFEPAPEILEWFAKMKEGREAGELEEALLRSLELMRGVDLDVALAGTNGQKN